jgi:hypothetical protein
MKPITPIRSVGFCRYTASDHRLGSIYVVKALGSKSRRPWLIAGLSHVRPTVSNFDPYPVRVGPRPNPLINVELRIHQARIKLYSCSLLFVDLVVAWLCVKCLEYRVMSQSQVTRIATQHSLRVYVLINHLGLMLTLDAHVKWWNFGNFTYGHFHDLSSSPFLNVDCPQSTIALALVFILFYFVLRCLIHWTYFPSDAEFEIWVEIWLLTWIKL